MSVSQISSSYQAAISVESYSGSTTSAQAKADLQAVLSNVIASTKATQSLPSSGVTAAQIQAIIPQDVALAASIAKATSSLKNLSSPLSPGESTEYLSLVQKIQEHLVTGVNAYGAITPACEAAIPGLNDLSYKTRKSLIDSLAEALNGALPSDGGTLKKLKTNIDEAALSAHNA